MLRGGSFVLPQAAGQPVHRTAFTKGAADGSLLFNPFDMQMKNVANTGVLHWGDKLLALYEVRGWSDAVVRFGSGVGSAVL